MCDRKQVRSKRSSRRGNTLVQATCGLTVVFGFASFALDAGRVQVARAEVQAAAAAGARAGANALGAGFPAARDAAAGAAGANYSEGRPIAVDPNADVEFGRWDAQAKSFVPLADNDLASADAVRVTVQRTAARGNAVQLGLASAIGFNTLDVRASSVARLGGGWYPFVGLDSLSVTGNGNTDSYDSSQGNYVANRATKRGTVASNGRIDVSGQGEVLGDAYSGSDGSGVHFAGQGSVSGTVGVVSGRLYFPAPVVPAPQLLTGNLGDLKINGGTYSLAAGDYVCSSLSIESSAVLQCLGKVRLYCTGPVTLTGGYVKTYQDRPVNFELNCTSDADVSLTGQANFYGRIYAPLSDVKQAGTADIYGTVIGKTLTFTGSWQGGAHADESIVGAVRKSVLSMK